MVPCCGSASFDMPTTGSKAVCFAGLVAVDVLATAFALEEAALLLCCCCWRRFEVSVLGLTVDVPLSTPGPFWVRIVSLEIVALRSFIVRNTDGTKVALAGLRLAKEPL